MLGSVGEYSSLKDCDGDINSFPLFSDAIM